MHARFMHSLLPLLLLLLASPVTAQTRRLVESPERSARQIALGDAHARNGDWRGAFNAYYEAVILDPGSGRARFDCGLMYAKLGHLNLAIRAWKSALQADPSLTRAQEEIDWARAQLGARQRTALPPQERHPGPRPAGAKPIQWAGGKYSVLFSRNGSQILQTWVFHPNGTCEFVSYNTTVDASGGSKCVYRLLRGAIEVQNVKSYTAWAVPTTGPTYYHPKALYGGTGGGGKPERHTFRMIGKHGSEGIVIDGTRFRPDKPGAPY